jgi:hypothetical protein
MYEYGELKLVRHFKKGSGRKENIRGHEPKWGTIHICGNITTKPSVKLSYTNKNIKKSKDIRIYLLVINTLQ